jgi:hypothetical protein
MTDQLTPRDMLKSLLQGVAPPRPLFLPIVFSLGARVENMPLRSFLANPTKIFNALRRMRAHLRADGVACYFDPWLEAEACGATLDWDALESPGAAAGASPLRWPEPAEKGELPPGLFPPEKAIGSGRAPVAFEVVRRLHAVLRDGSLLMAGVSGPFTLAARLTGLDGEQSLRAEDLPSEALEIAAALITQFASAFVEAGANLIFIQEDLLPVLSPESCDGWASLLAPTLNIVRFFQALPVLQFSSRAAAAESRNLVLQRHWDCLLCPTLDGIPTAHAGEWPVSERGPLALALPRDVFQADEAGDAAFHQSLHQAVAALHPAILTTADDVPAATDMKRLLKVLGDVPRAY